METKQYFPKRLNKALRFNREVKAMLDLKLNQIIDDEDYTDKIEDKKKSILKMNTPSSWNINDKDNMEREMEVEFEKALLATEGHNLTVFQFYSKLEYLEEKNENG